MGQMRFLISETGTKGRKMGRELTSISGGTQKSVSQERKGETRVERKLAECGLRGPSGRAQAAGSFGGQSCEGLPRRGLPHGARLHGCTGAFRLRVL